jgi:hypothetical protein
VSGRLAGALALVSLLVSCFVAVAHASPRATVWAIDDSVRIRRGDIRTGWSRGEHNPVWQPGGSLRLSALVDEVIAFQVVVEAIGVSLPDVRVELAPLRPHAPGPTPTVLVERFLEYYVPVHQRSQNNRSPLESLDWSPRARPDDATVLGEVPDPLIPIEWASSFAPYPFTVDAGTARAMWFDLTIPPGAAGVYESEVTVHTAGDLVARLPVLLTVAGVALPYRPVSFFAYYGADELERRIGDGSAAERQLWQLLHRHHVDALPRVTTPADLARLRPALDGSLFTPSAGYTGPGAGVPPAVLALGVYGTLGAPTPETVRALERLVPLVPAQIQDLFLYAADEQCDSPLGASWRNAIAGKAWAKRVRIAHTCDRDPSTQSVDLVLMPADRFDTGEAEKARARGQAVWVYNGAMPRTGCMALDAPVAGLRADAWIAATRPIDRWFLWETTFWDDDNRGGHGPVDPFEVAVNFHNGNGDLALAEGLLVYPATQKPPFAAHSLGQVGVIPSMRLKSLRRGIEDVGYLALALAHHPREAGQLTDRLLPAVLDEVQVDAAPRWPTDGEAFANARAALFAMVSSSPSLDRQDAERLLREAASARTPKRRSFPAARSSLLLLLALVAVVAAVAGGARRMRKAVGLPRPSPPADRERRGGWGVRL